MIPQTTVTLPQPVTLDLRIATGPRPRVVPPPGEQDDAAPHVPELHEFSEFPLYVHFDAAARTISAHLPPLPTPLVIYGPQDFDSAASDTMADHAARVLQCLGSDPAGALQGMLDGTAPELPPRIPRTIRAWQGREILRRMGLLATVESLIAQLADTAVTEAWEARENLARRGRTVLSMAAALGLSEPQLDALFIAADALEV